MKYVVINIIKYVQDPYTENHETLLKENQSKPK